MGPLAVREIVDDKEVLTPELDPSLVDELADIVKEAESTAKKTAAEIGPWFYFVPCAGVRYYSYRESPLPVER